jgi:hypothetical protein
LLGQGGWPHSHFHFHSTAQQQCLWLRLWRVKAATAGLRLPAVRPLLRPGASGQT